MKSDPSSASHRYFARVPHGLEQLAWRDLDGLGGMQFLARYHRVLEFYSSLSAPQLLSLRSLEDIFVYIGEVSGIGRHRTALPILGDVMRWGDFDRLFALKPELVGLRALRFSLTASFLGTRNYNRWEIADAIGAMLSEKWKWRYIDIQNPVRQSVDLHLRLHLEGDRALLGARLGPTPLYKRAYKIEHSKGSLNPCVAYLMAMLAKSKCGNTLLDPVCGVGTIPLEALSGGWQRTIGYDVDPQAISKAKINGEGFSGARFEVRDLFASNETNDKVDAVVSDLPWGAQTAFCAESSISPSQILDALRSLTKEEGILVLMVEDGQSIIDEAVRKGLQIRDQIPISLYGRHPQILVIESGDDCQAKHSLN